MKKKSDKKKKERVQSYTKIIFVSCSLVFSLYLLIFGVYIYGVGSHNIDLGHNIRIVNIENNRSYVDINNKFEVWTPTEMYITGFNQIDEGLYMCILGSLILGLSLNFFSIKTKGGN